MVESQTLFRLAHQSPILLSDDDTDMLALLNDTLSPYFNCLSNNLRPVG